MCGQIYRTNDSPHYVYSSSHGHGRDERQQPRPAMPCRIHCRSRWPTDHTWSAHGAVDMERARSVLGGASPTGVDACAYIHARMCAGVRVCACAHSCVRARGPQRRGARTTAKGALSTREGAPSTREYEGAQSVSPGALRACALRPHCARAGGLARCVAAGGYSRPITLRGTGRAA
jgi:hypothetical protein